MFALVPRLLGLDIPFNSIRTHIAGSGAEETPGPQSRHFIKFREFFSKCVRSYPFDYTHDFGRTVSWQAAYKKMHMVNMTFHSKYFNIMLPATFGSESFETLFHTLDIEYFASVPWAEHKMIVDK